MAVLPINTKIRGPAPISCKSDRREELSTRPEGETAQGYLENQEYPRDLGVRDGKGEIELEGRGRR
jgi:hypothetical protein